MTLGQKLSRLRTLEGYARGLDREMTQVQVSKAIREEAGGGISQAYLSQIESGARRHLTSETRALLARFFASIPAIWSTTSTRASPRCRRGSATSSTTSSISGWSRGPRPSPKTVS